MDVIWIVYNIVQELARRMPGSSTDYRAKYHLIGCFHMCAAVNVHAWNPRFADLHLRLAETEKRVASPSAVLWQYACINVTHNHTQAGHIY